MKTEYKIGIIGLGYVGLPLALAFSRFYDIIGFDIDKDRITQLKESNDINLDQVSFDKSNIVFTCDSTNLQDRDIYIITVPTPVNLENNPDLSYLISATEIVSKYVQKDNIIIYESTVYPGVTEDVCVPIIEKISTLVYNHDFFCGYSPERISPGDNNFTLDKMVKITSGSNKIIANKINDLYNRIIPAGTYQTPSIKIAEATKVIENIQRDVNIALINELAIIFDKMNIETHEVLRAARTKSNFIDIRPGIVGGHCISVDPYYLSYYADKLGVKTDLISLSRKINDNMTDFIVSKTIDLICKSNKVVEKSSILILGYTFKENCADTRNTKVKQLIIGLEKHNMIVDFYDPYLIDNIKGRLINNPLYFTKKYDAIIVAVAHNEFKKYTRTDFTKISKGKLVLLDIKGIYNKSYWQL